MCTKLEKHKEKCVMDDLKNIFQAIVNTCKKTPKHFMSVQNITNALKYLCQRLREDLIIRPPETQEANCCSTQMTEKPHYTSETQENKNNV